MNPNIPGMNQQPNMQPMPNTKPVQPQSATNVQQRGYAQNPYQQQPYSNPVNYQQPMQPAYSNSTNQQQPTQPAYQPTTQPYPQNVQPLVDVAAAVNNLNKEEAMEEALSHTTQYSPFQAQVAEIKPEVEQANNKKAIIMIAVIVAIIALFIVFLPQISNLFGWGM